MNVIILLIFVSLVLATSAVMFFIWNVRAGTHEHADRLALLPLTEDSTVETSPERPDSKGERETS